MNLIWVTHPLSALLMVLIPVALGIFLTRRFKLGWGVWWIGAAAFVASQVGHIPFNAVVGVMFERGWLPRPPDQFALVFSAIFLGLSAGMWEGWFRYIAYRWWAKTARSWRRGVLLGAGHGGIEAVILGGLSLYTFARIAFFYGKDLAAFFPADQVLLAEQQISSYWNMPWHLPLIAPLERVSTIAMHIAASVLVLQAFTRGSKAWVWLGVGWHALVDGVGAVYLPAIWQGQPWVIYAVEAVLGLAALISLGIIFLLKQPEPTPEAAQQPLSFPTPLNPLPSVEETPENLDKTRYAE